MNSAEDIVREFWPRPIAPISSRPSIILNVRLHRENPRMPAVRYLVDDVDAALPFYKAIGFKLADRWGPPFGPVELFQPREGEQ